MTLPPINPDYWFEQIFNYAVVGVVAIVAIGFVVAAASWVYVELVKAMKHDFRKLKDD